MTRTQIVRPRGRSAKRKTLWLDFASVQTATAALAAGASVLVSSLNAAALALRPFTIVRTRGIWNISSDQSSSPEAPFGALGYAVVSDQASAIGITAVPTPTSDAGSSLWFSWTPTIAPVRATTDIAYANIAQTREFDSKAMRKVEIGQDLVSVVENQSAAHGMNFITMARILIKTN